MISKIKKYKIEIILFLVAVLIRFFYAIVVQVRFGSHAFISFSDAATYLRMAHNLLDYHIFSEALDSPWLLPDAMRTILYPLFLAFFQLFKAPLLVIIFIQDLLAGAIAVMTYQLGVKIFASRSSGLIAALFFCLDPMSIYWNNVLMSETLAGFFFLAAVYGFVSKKYHWSGVFIGLATLVKPIFFYLAPLFLCMYIFLYWQALFSKKHQAGTVRGIYWKKMGIMCLTFILVIFPWALRNKIQFNTWQLSSNGWMAIHYFISSKFAEQVHTPFSWPSIDQNFYHGRYREVFYNYEFSVAPFYKQYLRNLIVAHPFDFVYFHISSAIQGFNNHDYNYLTQYVLLPKIPQFNKTVGQWFVVIGQGIWLVLYIFLLYSFSLKGKRVWQFFLISFYLLNNLLTGSISVGSGAGRYGLPFLPLTLLVAVYGLSEFYTYVKTKQRYFLSRKTTL